MAEAETAAEAEAETEAPAATAAVGVKVQICTGQDEVVPPLVADEWTVAGVESRVRQQGKGQAVGCCTVDSMHR